ncbi:MAG: MFS transporter [Pseudomonadota bacterium]
MSDRARAAFLTAAYYAVIFAALGAHLPYWPVWLEHWGLTTAEIGWYLGAATVARVFGTTVIPAIADHYAVRRWTIVVTSLATVMAHLAHLLAGTPAVLLAVTLIAAIVMAPSIPTGEALGLRAAERFGFAYAPVRAAGSVGFLIANIAVGAMIGELGPNLVLWTIVVGFSFVAILGAVHPGGGAPAGSEADRASPREVLRLFTIPAFLTFAVVTVLGHASHMVYYVYSVLDWRAQGISDATIGWLWATGVIAETVLMLGPGRRWVARLGAAYALGLGAAAGVLRWAAFTTAPDPLLLWPLQALHALSFGLAHLGAMAFLAAALPGRMIASAQGVMTGILGGGLSALVLIVASDIIEGASIAHAYWLVAAISLMSAIGAIVLGRLWQGQRLADDTSR